MRNERNADGGMQKSSYSEKFGADEIRIGKTSTKRATNIQALKDN